MTDLVQRTWQLALFQPAREIVIQREKHPQYEITLRKSFQNKKPAHM